MQSESHEDAMRPWYYVKAFYSGMVGAIAMTVIMILARRIGVTALNLEMINGSFLTHAAGGGTWLLGLVLHLTAGGIFAILYAMGFEKLLHRHHSNAMMGTLFGVLHAVISGLFMGALPALHPLIPELMQAPGIFGFNYGAVTAGSFVLLHLLFGSIVGSLYDEHRNYVSVYQLDQDGHSRKKAA